MSTKTSSRQIKLHKKEKLAIRRWKSPKDDGGTLDSRKKGFRGNRNAEIRIDDAVDVRYDGNKLYRKESRGTMNVKSKGEYKSEFRQKVDGEKGYKPMSNDWKRKRVYGDRDNSNEGMFHKNVEKSPPKFLSERLNERKYDVSKGKHTTRGNRHDFEQLEMEKGLKEEGKSRERKLRKHDVSKEKRTLGRNWHDFDQLEKEKGFRGERKPRERESLAYDTSKEKRTMRGNWHDSDQLENEKGCKGKRKSHESNSVDSTGSRKLRLKSVGEIDSVKVDGSGNSLMKNDDKTKSDSSKQLEQKNNGRTVDPLWKFGKKKGKDKKSVGDGLAESNERPKKNKRVIRIDPHDTSNKRLDDGIVTFGHTKDEKEHKDENINVEMSQNAQFRAINPSPSILSFVEDNFLGRRRSIELRRAGYNTELSAPLDNIPFSTSSERERIEESIFRNKLTFFAAAKVSSSFPPPDLPEIAFAGRSNVGKSSLLNSLTRQWGIVRTSDKPGLTQTINFFNLEPKLCLVDLPGYGFAYAKEEVKEAWEELVKEYVSTRVGLRRVCLLIDTKWGMKPRDHELINLMERSQTKYQIVLTKTDLVFPIDVARRAMQIEENLKAKKSAVQPVMMVSSKSGAGIRSLRTVLSKIARFAKL